MNRLQSLHDAGVSIWLDTLSRELLDSGEFARLIADCAVTGATSNPTIFAKAITGSDRYDDQLRVAALPVRARLVSCSSGSPSKMSGGPRTCSARHTTTATDATDSSRSNAPRTWPTTARPPSSRRSSCGGGSRGPT